MKKRGDVPGSVLQVTVGEGAIFGVAHQLPVSRVRKLALPGDVQLTRNAGLRRQAVLWCYEKERSSRASIASRPLSSMNLVPVPANCVCVITGAAWASQLSPFHSNHFCLAWS